MNNNNKALPNNISRHFLHAFSAAVITVGVMASPVMFTAPAMAESGIVNLSASTNTKTVKVARAIPKTIRTNTSFSEIVVGDPDVAVVNPLTDRSFYVVGQKAGTTGIALYDANNDLVGMLDIQVGANTAGLNQTLKKALPKSRIKASSANGRVVLSGRAKSSVAAAKARKIAKQYDKEMIDSVSVSGSQQVKLEVRFVEAQRSKTKELGLNLHGTDGTTRGSCRFGEWPKLSGFGLNSVWADYRKPDR